MIDINDPSFDPIALFEEYNEWYSSEGTIKIYAPTHTDITSRSDHHAVHSFLLQQHTPDEFREERVLAQYNDSYHLAEDLIRLWYPDAA